MLPFLIVTYGIDQEWEALGGANRLKCKEALLTIKSHALVGKQSQDDFLRARQNRLRSSHIERLKERHFARSEGGVPMPVTSGGCSSVH